MLDFFISSAWAQEAAGPSPQAGMFNIIFLVVLLVLFYFLLIRPQQKRAKEHRKLVEGLQKGDEVMIEGGIMGRITELAESSMTMEISENVEIKVRRQSIASVLPKGTLEKL
ncbi:MULTISPECIES: preprotein translocase subunit YajC [Nitrosococcus]|uniref:Sec translocon accessory complex subunit YajC n=3 Tax=Nitrosococcus TaxID=1227 RepID=Q3J8N7_NITOC|nr:MULTISPECIES: preprotein translocase subunit YajC [Nitrosococcus]KFI18617.1 preprotein translocase subunit YidC [Nitrosococcus oceani C-27]ABA58809.1 protein translocase subunit yajC [Nitrosococcus oceani ATCC 19707]EDZ67619.1 preprotein translocase, YajC subunit [Nitrosococcus oceani AFC27]KFI22002.1 preprotein translocase subunit YidC [Nitrosococcus oceani]GEM19101.1 preprotein translocase subunit YajC [Nitrosococcus oceani]